MLMLLDVEFDDIVVVIVGDAVNVGNDFDKNWKINLCMTCVWYKSGHKFYYVVISVKLTKQKVIVQFSRMRLWNKENWKY